MNSYARVHWPQNVTLHKLQSQLMFFRLPQAEPDGCTHLYCSMLTDLCSIDHNKQRCKSCATRCVPGFFVTSQDFVEPPASLPSIVSKGSFQSRLPAGAGPLPVPT